MHEKLAAAAREMELVRRRRDRLIVEATELGMSRREVGAAVGLTAAGVQHVIRQSQRRTA